MNRGAQPLTNSVQFWGRVSCLAVGLAIMGLAFASCNSRPVAAQKLPVPSSVIRLSITRETPERWSAVLERAWPGAAIPFQWRIASTHLPDPRADGTII